MCDDITESALRVWSWSHNARNASIWNHTPEFVLKCTTPFFFASQCKRRFWHEDACNRNVEAQSLTI